MNYTWKRGSSRQKDQLDGYCNSLKCGDETRRRKIQKINKRKNGSVQFSSAAQSCPTLCDPMESSMPGLPVCHQLPELTHTHVDQVGDAIQPSHPLSSPTPPAFNLSQHQCLFQESALQIRWPKHCSFNISPSNEYSGLLSLGLTGLVSLQSKGISKVFSNTPVQNHEFFSPQPLWSNSHFHT